MAMITAAVLFRMAEAASGRAFAQEPFREMDEGEAARLNVFIRWATSPLIRRFAPPSPAIGRL
jgi:hypothetical protein